jgi:FkbM family methyltransferase
VSGLSVHSALRALALASARTLPTTLRHAFARIPGLKRLYSQIVAGDGFTTGRVLDGPLQGTLIEFNPSAENQYWSGNYEADTQRILAGLAVDGTVAWDVGAHIGFFSLLLAQRCQRVLAIEPSPDNARRLRTNVGLNEAPIDVIEAAVGREPGIARLTIADEGRKHSIADRRSPGIAVPQITLDQLAEEHGFPSLIKIDIEGAELGALLGAADILARRTTLLIEVHSPHLIDEITHLLNSHGYRVQCGAYSREKFVPTRLLAQPPG